MSEHSSDHSLVSGLDAMSLKAVSPAKLNQRPTKQKETFSTNKKAVVRETLIGRDKENGKEVPQKVVSKIKNENFHLQLELEQKNHEIAKLKAMLLPKLTPPAIDLKNTVATAQDSLFYQPGSHNDFDLGEIASHFSSSSYDGNRHDINETSTIASTTSSRKEKNHMLFTRAILPFIRNSINMYKSSHILSEEVIPLQIQFEQFYSKSLNKEERCDILSDVLIGLLRIQRLNVAALNRELELKTIDRKMDYLAALFTDPQEYNMPRDKYLKGIKDQMLDVIVSLYGELPNIPYNPVKNTKQREVIRHKKKEPEILPIGYTNFSAKPSKSKKNRARNIKLTPFKIACEENVDPEDEFGLDLSDPLHQILAERLTGTDLDDSSGTKYSL